MSSAGHNGGPSLEPGRAWRRHCWAAARAALLPKLPIEVVRLRVKRAAEIGLDYKTYAGVRAATGHDIVAFLFSTNALNLLRETDRMAETEAAKLAGLRDLSTLVAVQPPLEPGRVAQVLAGQGVSVAAALHAPDLRLSWVETGQNLVGFLRETRHPGNGVLVIGATTLEREWATAGRLAGFLPAPRFFTAEMAATAR